jgi:hypothetical protein
MTANFQEQVWVKADSELLNIFVNADEYQEAFVDAVEEELTRRNVNLEEFKKEKK